MEYLKIILGSIVGGLVLLVGSVLLSHTGTAFGAVNPSLTTLSNPYSFTNSQTNGGVLVASSTLTGNKIGQVGNKMLGLNFGTCFLNLGNAPASFAASTTINVDCQASNMLATSATAQSALQGITAGDKVFVAEATTTPTLGFGLIIQGQSASSTAGYISLKLYNGTGAAYTPGTTTVAGYSYEALR